jgi:hypothetical protein
VSLRSIRACSSETGGRVTERHISRLREAGFPYMVGYHKRGRIVSDQLLEKCQDLSRLASIQDNVRYLEVPASAGDTVPSGWWRFIGPAGGQLPD